MEGDEPQNSHRHLVFSTLLTSSSSCSSCRSKPALTQAWVNDAAYFDGTGFAEVTITDEAARIQRFEQEVKLLSHNGLLMLLHNGVSRMMVPPPLLLLLLVPDQKLFFFFRLNLLLCVSRTSSCVWQCCRAASRSSMTSLESWWSSHPRTPLLT